MSNFGVWGHGKSINQCEASLCKTVFLLLFVCGYSKLLSVVFLEPVFSSIPASQTCTPHLNSGRSDDCSNR